MQSQFLGSLPGTSVIVSRSDGERTRPGGAPSIAEAPYRGFRDTNHCGRDRPRGRDFPARSGIVSRPAASGMPRSRRSNSLTVSWKSPASPALNTTIQNTAPRPIVPIRWHGQFSCQSGTDDGRADKRASHHGRGRRASCAQESDEDRPADREKDENGYAERNRTEFRGHYDSVRESRRHSARTKRRRMNSLPTRRLMGAPLCVL
jgi:hypothetical protein